MQARRTIPFFLLLLSATPLFFLLFLQGKQLYIRHTLEERLEQQLLKTIVIPKQDFKQITDDEILVDDRMFDVKEMQETASAFIVRGVFDDEETSVLQQLSNTSDQHSKDDSLLAQAFQLLHQFFFQPAAESKIITTTSTKLFQNPILNLPLGYKQVLSPPPQQA